MSYGGKNQLISNASINGATANLKPADAYTWKNRPVSFEWEVSALALTYLEKSPAMSRIEPGP